MSAQASTTSATGAHTRNKPSVSRRVSVAVSAVEQGEAGPQPARVQHQIAEEIDEIKRYEVSPNNRPITRTSSNLAQGFTTLGNTFASSARPPG